MVFGMGTRLAWGGLGTNMSAVLASPEVQEVVPVWRFWNDWGIAEAQMLGADGNSPFCAPRSCLREKR